MFKIEPNKGKVQEDPQPSKEKVRCRKLLNKKEPTPVVIEVTRDFWESVLKPQGNYRLEEEVNNVEPKKKVKSNVKSKRSEATQADSSSRTLQRKPSKRKEAGSEVDG